MFTLWLNLKEKKKWTEKYIRYLKKKKNIVKKFNFEF